MRYILIICLSIIAQYSYAQHTEYITEVAPQIAKHIPNGYIPMDTTYGDLNRDSIQDVVLIVRDPNEKNINDTNYDPSPRSLLLLIGKPDGSYQLAARNDSVVLCYDCGGVWGDPFFDVVIKRGYFSVEHYGGSAWRWTHIITFKYNTQKHDWLLHKVGGESYHAGDPEGTKEEKVQSVKDFGIIPFVQYSDRLIKWN